MKIFLLLMLFSFSAFASIFQSSYSLRSAKFDGGERAINAYAIDNGTVYTTAMSPNSSVDPFTSKTNKYAEAKAIQIVASGFPVFVKFGTSAISAAAATDYYLPKDTILTVGIDSDNPYLRVFAVTGGGSIWVTELK